MNYLNVDCSVSSKKILRWAFSEHAITQSYRRTASKAFQVVKGYTIYIRYQIWNVASGVADLESYGVGGLCVVSESDFCPVRMSNWIIFYITLLNTEFLLKSYNFLSNFCWNRDSLLCTTISIDFNNQPFMLRSRKFSKVGVGSRKFWKGWSRIFYLRLRNPGCKCARARFHCANGLLVLRSCAPQSEHGWIGKVLS